LVLQLYLLVLMGQSQHIHQLEGISHRLGPGVVIEIDPDLLCLQLVFSYARRPPLNLLFAVEIIIPI